MLRRFSFFVRSYSTRLSYAHNAGRQSLLYETLGNRLRKAVEKSPDREFVVLTTQGVRKTYEQTYVDSRKLATGLLHLGLKRGDKLAIWGPNSYEWITTQLAAHQAGLVLTTINPAYRADELAFVLERADVRALILQHSFRRARYYETLAQLAAAQRGDGRRADKNRLPLLEHIIVYGHEAEAGSIPYDAKYSGAWNFETIKDAGGADEVRALENVNVRPDDPAMILFTSGTTGRPKPAMTSHFNLVNNTDISGRQIRFDEGNHRLCVPNPLFHDFGCVVGTVMAFMFEQTLVIPDYAFNPSAILRAIEKERCTSIYGSPTMFVDILSHSDLKTTNISSLRTGMIGSMPCPVTLVNRLADELNMKDVCVVYGTTEGAGLTTMSCLDEPLEKRAGHVGFPLEHVELLVIDDDGNPVPRGEMGELLSRTTMNFLGYYKDLDATRRVLNDDNWHHTGDLAIMNDDDSINIIGRNNDMYVFCWSEVCLRIIRGGENIYPTEIEQFFHKMPFVADCQIVGVPDERLGEECCVWIRLRPGFERTTVEEIRNHCTGKISHFKIPRYIVIKQEKDFPMTPTAKIKKNEMRAIAVKELGLSNIVQ